MKVFFLFSICMLAFISCSKDDEDDNLWLNQGTFDIDGFMFDGGNLDSICFYCTEKDDNSYNTSVKTFKSYTDISFKTFGIDGEKNDFVKEPEATRRAQIQDTYIRQRTAFILEEFYKWPYIWPIYRTAYVDGKVSITCDKVLFGEEAGTELSKYFKVEYEHCVPAGIENPKFLYHYGDEIPSLVCDFFQKDIWFRDEYKMALAAEPAEKYDELTFHLTVPLTLEHLADYSREMYNTGKAEKTLTEKTYTSNCMVRFNWEE